MYYSTYPGVSPLDACVITYVYSVCSLYAPLPCMLYTICSYVLTILLYSSSPLSHCVIPCIVYAQLFLMSVFILHFVWCLSFRYYLRVHGVFATYFNLTHVCSRVCHSCCSRVLLPLYRTEKQCDSNNRVHL